MDLRPEETARPWHARAAAEALSAFGGRSAGLDPAEAARRLGRDGRNELPAAPRRPALLRFLGHFHNALIYLLLVAALVALLVDHPVDAVVIFAVTLVNAAIGFIQEGRAENAMRAVQSMVAPAAMVLRGGHRVRVPAAELVAGDIVLLEPGDRVPADMRLVRAFSLRIDEAALTGESVPAGKSTDPCAEAALLGDRRSMAFAGTMVAAGQGSGVVVATGPRTELGHINAMLSDVAVLTTPLLRKIDRFGRWLTVVAVGLGAGLYAWALQVTGLPAVDALLTVVAVAVALVPEGLPAVITITLAIGVQRMAARNAIVRRLPAVETLGATSVICSDKTGTLTLNEMAVRRVIAARRSVDTAEAGHGSPAAWRAAPEADGLIRCAVLCNDAQPRPSAQGGASRAVGDPMEVALVVFAAEAGADPAAERAAWPRLAELPFDTAHKYMATLHAGPGGDRRIFVKGAPEQLLRMSAAEARAGGDAPLDTAYWSGVIDAAAHEGQRVLGFAETPAPGATAVAAADVAGGLRFLGIAGFIDPPRPEAIAAVAVCRQAGIAVKMITGDHAATALAIARQLGLAESPRAVTGAEIEALSDADLVALAAERAVFARTTPEHKLRLVRALQARGSVVAMTGDGVNDAPALKQADVGVAMGRKGTEAAKEAAEIVLADDNFASIAAAVREGRTVFDNIRKVISWTLPTNCGEAIIVALAVVLGLTAPISPVQILWVNLVTGVTLGLVLAFEPPESDVMTRPPRAGDAPLLPAFLVWRVIFVSLLFVTAIGALFAFSLGRGDDIATARTLVVNQLVVLEIAYLFNVRYLHHTSISLRGVHGTPAVLAAVGAVVLAQAAFTYLPAMQATFDTRALPLADLALIGTVGALVLALCEGEKLLMLRNGLMARLGG